MDRIDCGSKAHASVSQQLDAQMTAEHGLSLSAYEVLMFLTDAPEHRMRMSEIAKAVLLSRRGCTRSVDRLVEHGYLSRHAVSNDGRGLYALQGTNIDPRATIAPQSKSKAA
jgi:DNA-binding MarR family transcriptional regulator